MLLSQAIPKILTVFGIGFVTFWVAIVTGLAMGLGPVVVVLATSLSYSSSVAIVLLLGKPIRDRLMARFGSKAADNPNSAIRRAWDRYGIIGLALLAPMTAGGPIGALIGLALNAPPRRLFLWMSFGGLLYSIGITVAILLGVVSVQSIK